MKSKLIIGVCLIAVVIFLALAMVECNRCSGIGITKVQKTCGQCSNGNIACEDCNGIGEYSCGECSGLGEFRCTWSTRIKQKGSFWAADPSPCNVEFHCSGGKIRSSTEWHRQKDKCMAYELNSTCRKCNGRGFSKCSTCRGASKFKCTRCSASGSLQCQKCKGEGHTYQRYKCSSCNGDGKVKWISKFSL